MFGPLRSLVLELNQAAFGVDAMVSTPDADPIATKVIWLTPITDLVPAGLDHQRAEPVMVMAISRLDVPTVPRGTLVTAALREGEAAQVWRVTGTERVEAEHVRVIVVAEPE